MRKGIVCSRKRSRSPSEETESGPNIHRLTIVSITVIRDDAQNPAMHGSGNDRHSSQVLEELLGKLDGISSVVENLNKRLTCLESTEVNPLDKAANTTSRQ